MKVIGITGGVGSGKSTVLECMKRELQAVIYQADLIAHQLQQPGEVCYKKIVEVFGKQILNVNGLIDRGILGKIVFSDAKKLEQLNHIIHPEVKKYIVKQIEKERAAGTKLFVVEAALLIEDHYEKICDEFWYIYANEQVRKERLKESRGYEEEKINSIMASQMSDAEYRKHCEIIIDNSGVFEHTCRQIIDLGERVNEIM